MKKGFYPTILCLGLLFFTNNSFSQELVKPVQNKSVKQAEIQSVSPSGTSSSSESNPTKMELYQQNTGNQSNNQTQQTSIDSSIPVNPSDATRDDANYQELKSEWIKKNPEKYKTVSGNPNLQILTQSELLLLPADQQALILADEINYLIIK